MNILFLADPKLKPALQFTDKLGELSHVYMVTQYWVAFLAMELPHITAEDKRILIEGGRIDRFLSIVEPSGAWTQNAVEHTNILKLRVRAWADRLLDKPTGESHRLLWEALPTAYRGPITICARDGHIAEGGDKISGRLRNWMVQSDGTGRCVLYEYNRVFAFQLEDVLSGELVQLHNLKMPSAPAPEPAAAAAV